MSSCTLYSFKNGKPDDEREYQNAWGGSARIWDALFQRYLKPTAPQYASWLSDGESKRLWKLISDNRLTLDERAVLGLTFDWAIIERENLPRIVQALRSFVEMYPRGDRVCHLLSWANDIEAWHAEGSEAVGLWGTSVSEDPWKTWDEEKEESVPYDLTTDTKHIEVYKYIEKLGFEQRDDTKRMSDEQD